MRPPMANNAPGPMQDQLTDGGGKSGQARGVCAAQERRPSKGGTLETAARAKEMRRRTATHAAVATPRHPRRALRSNVELTRVQNPETSLATGQVAKRAATPSHPLTPARALNCTRCEGAERPRHGHTVDGGNRELPVHRRRAALTETTPGQGHAAAHQPRTAAHSGIGLGHVGLAKPPARVSARRQGARAAAGPAAPCGTKQPGAVTERHTDTF